MNTGKKLMELGQLASAVLAVLALGCSGQAGKDKFVRVHFPDGASVTAELAISDEERQQGLMFREKIEGNQGMLFVFEEEAVHSFWMKNMRFPIDILWLDKEKRIIHIEQNVPPCPGEPCPSYTPAAPAKFVLELKSDGAADHKLQVYDRIEFILPRQSNGLSTPQN